MNLEIKTPRWCLPLLNPCRYKGARGGRGSGKSHFFAEYAVEQLSRGSDHKIVCIREVQKSLKYSAKALIEGKIRSLGVSHLFDIRRDEILRLGGSGIILFQGMQDHTADSIKSLEGFDGAWVEEAQNLSKRSLDLLRPTIRNEGSEIWFSWNPDQPTDAVDEFILSNSEDANFACVHVNSNQNPWLSETLKAERERDRIKSPESFGHIWLGEYNTRSEAQVFAGKWAIEEFEPQDHWGEPYHGLDFGFANDPTAAIRCWIADNCLWIDREAGRTSLELDETAALLTKAIPSVEKYTIRADSARPESISYLKRHGLPRMAGVKKGAGSVEDGIEHIKSYDKVIIHRRCEKTAQEFRLYSYKIDKRSGDILPKLVDENNHYIDALRYALEPIMKRKSYNLDNL